MTTSDPDPVTSDACLRCGHPLSDWGIVEFRTGGTAGTVKLVIGELGELGETKVPIDFRYCTSCGQVDLRLPANG